jgi:nickel/cobalt exporter
MRAALTLLFALPAASHADTVASLLGNFTINQFSGVHVGDDTLAVRYTVVFGQLPALRELHVADTDGDGVTSQAERDAYVERLGPSFANQLKLTVDGVATPLHVTRWTSSLPTEQGGFSLRLDVDLAAALPTSRNEQHMVRLANENYPGRFGWQEMVVDASPSTKIFDTNAFSTSLTADLTDAVSTMPAAGPPNERTVHFAFTEGALPAGVKLIQARPGAASTPETSTRTQSTSVNSAGGETAWLQAQTRRLITLISAPDVAPHVLLLALLAAVVLGALHAFSPGHGKTVVGAYLIGSRGTPRHAVFLGTTVTITHTLGVFALGFATLFASRFIVPERLFPVLSLASGALVLGMGVILLAQRWRAARDVLRPRPRGHARAVAVTAFRPLAMSAQRGAAPGGFVLAYAQGHHAGGHHHHDGHDHYHAHGGAHEHAASGMHSHGGGRMHSHLPPGAAGEPVTWRGLLALGISGGLVPCPSAMVLLLAAVALNKTAFGLLLVVAFSIGLAMTLTAVGLAFLYARNRLRRPASGARWRQLLPVASAAAITVLGIVLCYGALSGASF